MAKLQSANLLGDSDVPEEEQPRKSEKGVSDRIAAAKAASASKPSPYQSDLREKLRDKTQFSFGHMPTFVVDIFDAQAAVQGMNRREYFYSLLRDQGGDIPPYAQMDGRKL